MTVAVQLRLIVSTFLALLVSTLAANALPVEGLSSQEVDPPADAAVTLENLESLVNEIVPKAMREADVPGVAVTVVQAGRVLLAKGYGFADIEANRPVDPQTTVFRLGSIAKPVSATVILAVLEEVGFDLDQDVRGLLDDLDLGQTEDRPLTLRQLLSHTAGYSENLFGQHAAEPGTWRPLGEYLRDRLPPAFAPPGEVIAYSDFHTSLAGLATENLAGADFASLAETTLFRPLGMSLTTYRQVDLPVDIATHLARSYGRSDGRLVPYRRDYVKTVPAAGLQSSASDMARYLIALLDGGRGDSSTIMSRSAWRQQKTVQHRFNEHLMGKALGLTEVLHGGRTLLYKDGQASGFHARFVLVPEADLAVFSVHNRTILGPMGAFNAAAKLNRELGWAIIDELVPPLEAEPLPAPEPLADTADRLPLFEGIYRTTVTSRHTAEKMISMADEIVVRRQGDRLDLGFGPVVETAPGVFQWHEGGSFFAAFSLDEGQPSRYLYMGSGAFERIPWYESSGNTMWFIASFVGLFFMAMLLTAWKIWAQRRRGDTPRAARRLALCAGATATLDLLFLGTLGGVLAVVDIQTLFAGWPWTVKAALALPILSIVPLALLGRSLLDREARSAVGRLSVGLTLLVFMGGVTFLAWLHTWNLLGWRL